MGNLTALNKVNGSSPPPTNPGLAHASTTSITAHHLSLAWPPKYNGRHCVMLVHLPSISLHLLISLLIPISSPTERLMASLPASHQHLWQDLLCHANHHVSTGMVAANNQQRNRYWKHWLKFLPTGFDPYLQSHAAEDRLAIIQAFTEWARRGNMGRGHQIKAGTVQDAISAIGTSFELAGFPNPLFQHGTKTYHKRLHRQIEAFHREDPPAKPQLAVPVRVPNWIFRSSCQSQRPHIRAIGELCLIAFYFLLRVGEYTQPQQNCTTRTQQF